MKQTPDTTKKQKGASAKKPPAGVNTRATKKEIKRTLASSIQVNPATPDGEMRDARAGFDGPLTGSFGVSGLRRSGIYLHEEWHPKLKGKLADKTYREMEDNSPLIGGALWGLESLVRQVGWRYEAKKQSGAGAKDLAEWFEGDRTDMDTSFESIISEIMSMPVYGWANLEQLWKVRRGPEEDVPELKSQFSDGLFGTRDLAIRSQDSRLGWEWDREGRILGMYQQVETESKLRFIPASKSLLFRIRERKGSPEGRSLLRNCYRPYYFITNEEELEAIAVSRILNGLAVFEVPIEALQKGAPEAMQTLRALAENAVKQIRYDTAAGLVIPSSTNAAGQPTGVKLSLLSPGGTNPAAAHEIITRHRTDLLIALLFQFLLLGSGQTGSWSLASEMTDLLAMAINAILRSIASVFTMIHVPRLARLNNFDPRILPELVFTDIEKPDVLKLWQAMAAYTQAGGVMDNELDNYGREESGWPKRADTGTGRIIPNPAPPDPTGANPTPNEANPSQKRARTGRSKLHHPRSALMLPGIKVSAA